MQAAINMNEMLPRQKYGPEHDQWLANWHDLLAPLSGERLLEIGCGAGHDSAYLCELGFSVAGVDLDQENIDAAKLRNPAAQFEAGDLREYLRDMTWQPRVIVASLSLHYFDWLETVAIFNTIHAKLGENGLFLLRLNSTNDHHYGASGHPQIEPHFYNVNNSPKRFFDLPNIERLMNTSWHLQQVQEHTIHRYANPKIAWEIVATAKNSASFLGNKS